MSENNTGRAAPEQAAQPTGTKKKRKGGLIALCSVLAAALLGYGGFCAAAATSDKVFPNTRLLGQDLGGMTMEEATERLASFLPETCRNTKISVHMDGEEKAGATLAELGFQPRAEDVAELCYGIGRDSNLITGGAAYIRALLGGADVALPTDYDAAVFDSTVNALADRLDREARPLSCRYDKSDLEHVFFRAGVDGISVDRGKLADALRESLTGGEYGSVDCAYEVIPFDSSITVQTLIDALPSEGKNAGYNVSTGKIYEGTPGIVVKPEDAENALKTAAPGEEVSVNASLNYPKVSASELEGKLFRDTLASYTTSVSGAAVRRNNVRLAARAINGTVLNSGDVFSYNGTVGKRTEAKGYGAAPAYIGGATVDTVGGGVCQPSSTLYAACLLANLKIVDRSAHRYTPSYIPLGMDATVSWPSLDYKFQNNTDYPIKIMTFYSNDRLTVKLIGTKVNDNYVRITTKDLGTTPYETIRKETKDLPAGKEEVEQTAYTGRKVKTYRNVYSGSGKLLSSTFEATSDYKARDKIILVGIGEPITPVNPAPDPSPDPGSNTGGNTGGDAGGIQDPVITDGDGN